MHKKNLKKTIGQQLADIRKRRGLSCRQLSRLCGISDRHIGAIEKGHNVPREKTIYAITEALGYNFSYSLRLKKSEKK